jgi:hypothetical protein
MITFELGSFWQAMENLRRDIQLADFMESRSTHEFVTDQDHERFKTTTARFVQDCTARLRINADTACWKLEDLFKRRRLQHYKYSDIKIALERLMEDTKLDAMLEYFFHYPREMSALLLRIPIDWETVLAAFPSSKREIETGTDCYALGDYAGCVFHMMGLAELGLRAIAKERGVKSVGKRKPIEWGTWQDVFAAIEGQLKIVRNARPGPKRDAALSFCDTALSDLRRLQGYRDPTMHFRAIYDKGEAYDAMHRAKSFMQTLATKLNEAKPRKIRWGL